MRNDPIDIDGDGPAAAEWAVGPIPWTDFAAELLSAYAPPAAAVATYRKMKHDLDLVGKLVAVTPDGAPVVGPDGAPVPMVRTTADLTLRTIASLVRTRDAGPETVRSYLRSVRVACNVAVKTGRLRVSPFAIRPLSSWVRRRPPEGRRHLTRRELGVLLAALGAAAAADGENKWRQWKARRLHAMAAVAAYAGLRSGELYHLHLEDVDLPGRIIRVRPRKAHRLKTEASAAPVPMPKALCPIVAAWLEHRLDPPVFPPAAQVPWLFPGCRGKGPWSGGCPGTKPLHALQAAAAAAGVGHATWQMLRRSLATHLRSFGVSGAMASQVLRHSEEVDEAYYLADDLDNLRDAVADVEF